MGLAVVGCGRGVLVVYAVTKLHPRKHGMSRRPAQVCVAKAALTCGLNGPMAGWRAAGA